MPAALKKQQGVRRGRAYSSTDYLVVGDEKDMGTWEYLIRRNGAADAHLIHEAFAQIKHSDRADKLELLERLSSIHMTEVLEAGEAANANIKESYYGPMMGMTSFAAVRAAEQAQKATRKVHDLAYDFENLVFSIMSMTEGDKVGMLLTLADEFKQEVSNTLSDEMVKYSESEPITGSLGESAGYEAKILEVIKESDAEPLPSGPVKIKIAVIEPGWGNEVDNNYYPVETLRRDIHLFEGTKMYATDHDPKQKSVRTEVGTVLECPAGFTESGAPVAIVGIHNPIMAEDIRNRHALGVLDRLETSILGDGIRRKGRVGARIGNIVESITKAVGIDFVTKAGAGGRALGLAESAKGTGNMDKTEEKVETTEAEDTEVKANADTKVENVSEKSPAAIVFLSESQVDAIVSAAHLPKAAATRLRESKYLDDVALLEAIKNEREYIKQLTGSGSPTDNVNAASIAESNNGQNKLPAAANYAGVDSVNDKYFGGSKR